MKKFKNNYKLNIIIVGIATISMIGAIFTPIVGSIPINTNNNHNIIEQNKKIAVSNDKENSNNFDVLGLESEHQGIWVNVTKTINPKNIHPCEPATIFINISAQGNPLPIHIPVAVMLVIDTSGSMSWQYKNETGINHPALYYIKIAAINFINQMDLVNDTAGIVSFADHATLKKQLTHNKNDLINAINSLTANGATNTGEGIRIAQQELDSHTPNNAYPVMILMTDGLPTTHHQGNSWQYCENCPISNNTCTNYARSEANLSKAANTSIFSIAFTEGIYGYCQQNDTVDFANWLLLDISSGTDYFYTTADINTLEQIYQNISSKIGQIVINNLQVTDYLPNNIEVLSTGGGTYSVLPNGTKKMIFTKNFLSLNDTWHISFNISTNIIGNNILVNYPNSNLSYVITNATTNTTYREYLPYPNYINITNPLIMQKKASNQVYPGRQINYTRIN